MILNRNKCVRLVFSIAFIALSSLTVGTLKASTSSAANISASLRFSLSDQHGFPLHESKTNFDCSDKIYSVTEVSGLAKGKHIIAFEWVDPSSDVRERTEYDFFVREEPTTKLWAWLELSRATGASMLQWFNPAAGLEEFIGEWDVNILIDDKKYNTSKFDISC